MTFAPDNLLAVRRLLLDHLPGLDPSTLGIVGDAAHRGGYHCGRDRLDLSDYSVRESPRDRAGLSEAASALDIGAWSTSVAGKRHDLRSMSLWLVAQCKANAVDTRDIREVIYSPDGATVRRWDRLGIRSTGDSSHRWHTHISYHRDSAGRDQTGVWRRYLTEIGLMQAEEDDMTPEQDKKLSAIDARVRALTAGQDALTTTWAANPKAIEQVALVQYLHGLSTEVESLRADLSELASAVQELRSRPSGAPTREDLVAALREVLGSVDGATPPAQG